SRIGLLAGSMCSFQRTSPEPLPARSLDIFFGGSKAVVRPVPIPNTAVKRSLADGSGCIASARVGRRQIFFKPERLVPAFSFPATFVHIELINTGGELLLGRVLNTLQQWICRQLADLGYDVN